MGRKRLLDKKNTITIRIKSSVIIQLRTIKNYNSLVEKLLEEYFKKKV